MKKTISFISALMALLMIISAAAPLSAFAEEKEKAFSEKELTAYLFNMDDTVSITCLFEDTLPVFPYISAVDYLDRMYECTFTETKNGDGTVSVSNTFETMVIDAEKDTVYFDCYEKFISFDEIAEDKDHNEDIKDYVYTEEIKYEGEQKSLTLDLAKYGFDIVEYNGKVYFPLTILNDIMAMKYCAAEYIDG